MNKKIKKIKKKYEKDIIKNTKGVCKCSTRKSITMKIKSVIPHTKNVYFYTITFYICIVMILITGTLTKFYLFNKKKILLNKMVIFNMFFLFLVFF